MSESADEKYIKSLEKHADNLRANKFYSMQRIDLLIISVSGAGIYGSMEIMKYVAGSKYLSCIQIQHFNNYFKIPGVLFILAIIINFISQWLAYYESAHGLQSTLDDIYAREHNVDKTNEIKASDARVAELNKLTKFTNHTSTVLMILGLIFMIAFICVIF